MPSSITARPRPEAAERLLALAIAAIDTGGEAAIRVSDLSERAGVRTASLYKWFTDRDGLIIAAQRARYERSLEVSIDNFGQAVSTARDVDQFRRQARGVAKDAASVARVNVSLDRLNVIGSAITRPELLDGIRRRTHLYQEAMAVHLGRAQRNELIRPERDPQFISGWLFSASFGRVLLALGSDVVDDDYWRALFNGASHHLLSGERTSPHPSTPPYRPRVDRADEFVHPTARFILDGAVGEIIAGGEARLRLGDLTDRLGVPVTAVYQHFGSREELVSAAHAELLSTSYRGKLDLIERAIAEASDRDSLRTNVRDLVVHEFSRRLDRGRLGRLVSLAGSYGRPELMAVHRSIRDDYYLGVEHAFNYAKARGWVPVERDVATIMCWVDGMSIGECLVSLGIVDVDHDQWVETTADAVIAALS